MSSLLEGRGRAMNSHWPEEPLAGRRSKRQREYGRKAVEECGDERNPVTGSRQPEDALTERQSGLYNSGGRRFIPLGPSRLGAGEDQEELEQAMIGGGHEADDQPPEPSDRACR
jgi:hypothetical protein